MVYTGAKPTYRGLKGDDPRYRHRKGHRPDGRASPLAGVPRLPLPRRRGDRAGRSETCHSRQHLLPQVRRGQRMAEGLSRPDVPFHSGIDLVDECRRGLLLQTLETGGPARALHPARRAQQQQPRGHIKPLNANDARPTPLRQTARSPCRELENRALEANGIGITRENETMGIGVLLT